MSVKRLISFWEKSSISVNVKEDRIESLRVFLEINTRLFIESFEKLMTIFLYTLVEIHVFLRFS